jgi:thiamine-monophosphate kinase
LSLTAIGEIKKEKIAYRSTAKSGDLICVSGDLGGAYMGLLILEREKKVFQDNPEIQPDLDGNDYLIGRQLKPEARLDIINKLEKEKIIPTSMIDISDGLASEVLHICKNSNLGCALYEEKLPIDATTAGAANEFGLDPTTAAMNGGEDYELLFTISQSDYEKIKNIKDISIIGHIAEKSEGSNLISTSGHIVEIKAQGWDALKK